MKINNLNKKYNFLYHKIYKYNIKLCFLKDILFFKKKYIKIIHKFNIINIKLQKIFLFLKLNKNIENKINKIKINIKYLENILIFDNKFDINNCFIDIKSGAGGIDSQNWSYMLFKQYLKYCKKKKFKTKVLQYIYGENGIKYAIVKVYGKYAFGFLKNETGIHKLIRKSPFNLNNRHTSFSSLFVYPEINNSLKEKININDIRIDTYKSSGSGGQKLNKTNSAVRITHIPSGIIVQCQSSRSQYKNKLFAWNVLKSKIFNLQIEKKKKKKEKINKKKSNISWGKFIRLYILDKSLVKDLRINFETNKIKSILNGSLNNLILLILKNNILKKYERKKKK